MSQRSTARFVRVCVCGQRERAEVHNVTRAPRWWERLLRLAWPSWTRGDHEGHHPFLDRLEIDATRAQLRRVKRELARASRRAS